MQCAVETQRYSLVGPSFESSGPAAMNRTFRLPTRRFDDSRSKVDESSSAKQQIHFSTAVKEGTNRVADALSETRLSCYGQRRQYEPDASRDGRNARSGQMISTT